MLTTSNHKIHTCICVNLSISPGTLQPPGFLYIVFCSVTLHTCIPGCEKTLEIECPNFSGICMSNKPLIRRLLSEIKLKIIYSEKMNHRTITVDLKF